MTTFSFDVGDFMTIEKIEVADRAHEQLIKFITFITFSKLFLRSIISRI